MVLALDRAQNQKPTLYPNVDHLSGWCGAGPNDTPARPATTL